MSRKYLKNLQARALHTSTAIETKPRAVNHSQFLKATSVSFRLLQELLDQFGNGIERHRNNQLSGLELTYDSCKQELLEAVNLYKKTTLVLDALDECEPQSQNIIVEII